MMNLKKEVKTLAKKYANDVRSYRRHIHAHPELSFQEYQTAAYVASLLKSFGLTPEEGIARTGLTVIIKGEKPGNKNIALRADMDALPIDEGTEVPFKSTRQGVMHACGHDAHTSMLLGVARILNDIKGQFGGTVKLIFQPAEEITPGGASVMIKEGVLEVAAGKLPLQSIMTQHVQPATPTGKVGFKVGAMLASCDDIYMTVKGKGGHAAYPETLVDPVLIASQIIIGLQQVISRNASPHMSSVLSFGKVLADGATNIIPDTVTIEGTFRTFDEKWRHDALARITQMAKSIAQGMGGNCEVTIDYGCPFLYNAPQLTQRAIRFSQEFLGEENVEILTNMMMGSEDFAFYSQEMDACLWALGVRNEAKSIVSDIHTPTFDIDEDALETGVGLMTWLAMCELSQ